MESYQNNETDLECKVRKLIDTVTNSRYISYLNVEHTDGTYILHLGLNCKDACPISLGYQGDEKGFLQFLAKEFKFRRLQDINYTKGVLVTEDNNAYYPVIEI